MSQRLQVHKLLTLQDTAASYGLGAVGSLVYLRMLNRSIDSVGGFTVGAALGQPRLLVPVILTGAFNRCLSCSGIPNSNGVESAALHDLLDLDEVSSGVDHFKLMTKKETLWSLRRVALFCKCTALLSLPVHMCVSAAPKLAETLTVAPSCTLLDLYDACIRAAVVLLLQLLFVRPLGINICPIWFVKDSGQPSPAHLRHAATGGTRWLHMMSASHCSCCQCCWASSPTRPP